MTRNDSSPSPRNSQTTQLTQQSEIIGVNICRPVDLLTGKLSRRGITLSTTQISSPPNSNYPRSRTLFHSAPKYCAPFFPPCLVARPSAPCCFLPIDKWAPAALNDDAVALGARRPHHPSRRRRLASRRRHIRYGAFVSTAQTTPCFFFFLT